jgi:hypothetical protein
MAHKYPNILIHCVFSRKERRYLNPENWMPTLSSYFGGMGRNHRILAIASGGIANHVHRWIALPLDICVTKGRSSVESQLIAMVGRTWDHLCVAEG